MRYKDPVHEYSFYLSVDLLNRIGRQRQRVRARIEAIAIDTTDHEFGVEVLALALALRPTQTNGVSLVVAHQAYEAADHMARRHRMTRDEWMTAATISYLIRLGLWTDEPPTSPNNVTYMIDFRRAHRERRGK